MRRLRFGLNLLILLVPLVFVGLSGLLLVRRIWTYLNSGARLAGVASVEASRALGRDVRIRDIKFQVGPWSLLPNRVEVFGISVASGPAERQPYFGQADQVVAWYSLRQILFPTDRLAPYISQVQLIRPAVWLARDARGRWNFAQLIKPSAVPGRPLADKIVLNDGTVNYADQDFPHPAGIPARPLVTYVAHLSGIFLLRPDKSVAYTATGQGDPRLLGGFHSTGIAALNPLHIAAQLAADHLNLPNLGARLLPPAQGSVQQGLADTDLSLVYDPAAGTKGLDLRQIGVHGNLALHGVSLTSRVVTEPVTGLNGNFTIAPDAVILSLSTRFAGADITANGRMIGYTHLLTPSSQPAGEALPFLALQGSMRHADYQRITRAVRLASHIRNLPPYDQQNIVNAYTRGDFDFQVIGPPKNLAATVDGHLDYARYERYRADDLQVRAFYNNRILDVDARGKYAGGDAAARGHISFERGGPFEAEAHGRGLQLASFNSLSGMHLAGQGQVDFSVRGRSGYTPAITAQAEVANAQVNGQSISSAYASANTVGHNLVLSTLRIEDDKGFALASGTMDPRSQKLDLNVEADEIDIGPILQAVRRQLAHSGRPTPPLLAATVAANGAKTAPALNLDALQGIGYLRAHIGGTIRQPVIQGRASAFALQSGDIGVDRVIADFDVTKDVVRITNGTAERYPGELTFEGQVSGLRSGDPGLAITAKADNFDVTDLLALAGVAQEPDPANPTGSLLVTGRLQSNEIVIGGTFKDPRLERPVTVSLLNGSVNGLPLQAATLTASYGAQVIHLDSARVDAAGGTLIASGTVGKDRSLDINVAGTGLQLTSLLNALPKAANYPFTGDVSFQAHVTGTTSNLIAQAQAQAHNVDYKDFQVGDIRGNFNYGDKQVQIADLTLTAPSAQPGQPNAITVNHLTYDMTNQQISGTARWDEVPIQRLRELFAKSSFAESANGKQALDLMNKITQPIQGGISGTAVLSGTATDPVADLTWNASNILVQNYQITTLSGSALVNTEHLLIPSPSHPKEIARLESADANIEASKFDIAFGGKIDADVSARNLNLDFLRRWFPDQATNTIAGTGEIYFTVHGKTASPVVEASATLRNVTYGSQTIDAIDVSDIVIAEPTIQAGEIAFSKSYTRADGTQGKFEGQAHGSIAFSWQSPFIPKDAALNVIATVPEQEMQALTAFSPGLTLDTDGKFSASVQVANTLDDPRVTGAVVVQASRFRFGKARTGLQNISGRINFTGSQLEIAPGFTANTYIFSNTVPDKMRKGTPIVLTGSLPITNASRTPGAAGITLRDETLYVDENPLPVVNSGSVRGTVSLNLQVTGSVLSPIINGNVDLFDMNFAPPFNPQLGTGAGTGLPINPAFNLVVRVGRNVRVANPQLNARIDGEVTVKGRLFQPLPNERTPTSVAALVENTPPTAARQIGVRVYGNLIVREGYLQLPTAPRFTIVPPGTVALTYPAFDPSMPEQPTLGVTINVRAQTYMVLPSSSTIGGQKRYRVIVTARGPVTGETINPDTGQSRLALNITTDPPDFAGNQQQLQQTIAGALGGNAIGQFGRAPGQVITQELTSVFTSAVLPSLFARPAQALGFEELSIGYDPLQRFNLVATRHIFGPIYVTYMQPLGQSAVSYDITVSLRFQERYQLSYEQTEFDEHRVFLEGVWNF